MNFSSHSPESIIGFLTERINSHPRSNIITCHSLRGLWEFYCFNFKFIYSQTRHSFLAKSFGVRVLDETLIFFQAISKSATRNSEFYSLLSILFRHWYFVENPIQTMISSRKIFLTAYQKILKIFFLKNKLKRKSI